MNTVRNVLATLALGAGACVALPAMAYPVGPWDGHAQDTGFDDRLLAPLQLEELHPHVSRGTQHPLADQGSAIATGARGSYGTGAGTATSNAALYTELSSPDPDADSDATLPRHLHGHPDGRNNDGDNLGGLGNERELGDDGLQVNAVPLPGSLVLLLSGLAALLLVRPWSSRAAHR